MKYVALLGAGLLGLGVAPAYAQQPAGTLSAPVAVSHHGNVPVYHVEVVARTITAVNYRVRGDKTKIDFRGTPLEPFAKGNAKIRMSNGATHIQARFKKMTAATKFGPPYTTYVLWAITPAGRPVNLGEVGLKDHQAQLNTSTNLQAFGLIVTAEPYFAVTRPSNIVVLENHLRPSTTGEASQVQARYLLLRKSNYTRNAPAGELTALAMTRKVPLDYYEAQNALRIARWSGAPAYAPGLWAQAQRKYQQAQLYLERHAGRKPIAMMARAAAQTAEDARILSLRRQRIEHRRQEQEAMLAAKAAARRARARGAAAEAGAIAAQAEANQAREKAALARQQALAEQAQTAQAQAQAAQAQAEAQAARQQMSALTQQQAAERARLEDQLNRILATRNTAAGLIMNMPNVLFATNSYMMTPGAKIKLAKVAGVLAAYPGLQVAVNGYTDNTGTPGYNLQLSHERADAVRTFLTAQGVAPDSIVAQGFGEANPIAGNETAAGRQQNRRVELVISGAAIGTPQP